MDPTTLIVTALAAGATAIQQPLPDQAVVSAYHSLKALIQSRYPAPRPASTPWNAHPRI